MPSRSGQHPDRIDIDGPSIRCGGPSAQSYKILLEPRPSDDLPAGAPADLRARHEGWPDANTSDRNRRVQPRPSGSRRSALQTGGLAASARGLADGARLERRRGRNRRRQGRRHRARHILQGGLRDHQHGHRRRNHARSRRRPQADGCRLADRWRPAAAADRDNGGAAALSKAGL